MTYWLITSPHLHVGVVIPQQNQVVFYFFSCLNTMSLFFTFKKAEVSFVFKHIPKIAKSDY
jgi:hypothetical protein